MNAMTHARLRAEVLRWLGSRSWARVWPQPSGLFLDPRTRSPVRAGVKGCADLTGILAGGRRLEVECKTGTGKLHGSQPAFRDMILAMGGLYIVAQSVEDCREQLAAEGYHDRDAA